MSKSEGPFYLYIDGQAIPVTEDVYREYHRYTRKERYFSYDLKVEHFTSDQEKQTATFTPGREDSYERLLEANEQFPAPDAESPEDSVIKAEMLKKLSAALDSLSDDELSLIQELYYLEKTEREICASLNLAKTTLHRKKIAVLEKLRNILTKDF